MSKNEKRLFNLLLITQGEQKNMKKLLPAPYVEQSMPNLGKNIRYECKFFRKLLLDYNFDKKDVHLCENETYRTVSKYQSTIKRTIRENPDKFHFVIYLTSGHGMNFEGL